ncbi:RIP metalloprotease RseP [Gilliamella sp. wkB18]|nr:RIP metalloprotease RseP [Gilliamella apicola]
MLLWSLLLFLITISILVTVHEFGHFFIARLCGVRVECFSIGFGKKLWSHKFSSGTEFVIAMIPLGGYVKMLDKNVKAVSVEYKKFAYDEKKIWQRAAIIFAGPLANFVLAFILYWIIFLMGIVTYPVKIEGTIPNTPAAMINIPAGVELKKINNIDIESWNDVNLVLISLLGKDSISLSYLEDVGNNNRKEIKKNVDISHWHFDVEKESAIKTFGFIPKTLEIYPIVSRIISGSVAEKAGLQIGDKIISYDGRPYENWDDFAATIKKGKQIRLKVERENEILDFDLKPAIQKNGEGIVGLYPTSTAVLKQYGFLDGFSKGIEQAVLTIRLTARSLYQLVTGVIGLDQLSGPITIAKSAGQTASYGFTPYLYFLAFISISLGVINLVPLPMLDGGHLIFLLFEKINGKALSNKAKEQFFRIGFVLLMVIMGIALFNDFLRL